MRPGLGIIAACQLLLTACAGVQLGAFSDPDPDAPAGAGIPQAEWRERPADLCLPYVEDPATEMRDRPPPDRVFHPGSYTRGARCDLTRHAVVVRDRGQVEPVYYTPGPDEIPALSPLHRSRAQAYRQCLQQDPDPLAYDGLDERLLPVFQGLDCYAGYFASEHPDRPLRVIVFAHGGMVSQEDAIREAETLAPAMMHDGYYPIFLIWNSDFPNAYWNYLCCTNSRAEIENRRGYLYAPARIVGDVGSGVAQIPENLINQGVRSLDAVFYNDIRDPRGEEGRNSSTSPASLSLRYYLPVICDLEEAQQDPEYGPKPCENDSIYRARRQPVSGDLWGLENGFGNIIYPPTRAHAYHEDRFNELNGVYEDFPQHSAQYQLMRPVRVLTTAGAELGRNAWDDMVGRTRLAVRVPPDVQIGAQLQRDLVAASTPEEVGRIRAEIDRVNTAARVSDLTQVTQGGFWLFMNGLENRLSCWDEGFDQAPNCKYNFGQSEGGPRRPVEITFAGHSMGALVGNEIMRFFPDMPFDRIIYMAGASSVRDFWSSVTPYMRRQRNSSGACYDWSPVCTRFYNLMLHPQRESRETNIRYAVPQGSLLEWIDEMFEDPRSIDERTIGKWSNVVANRDLFTFSEQRGMMFRVFPVQADTRNQEDTASGEALDYETHWGFEAECDNAGVNSRSAAMHNSRYGWRCHPLVHGEFNDFSFWRDRFLLGRFAVYAEDD